MGGPRLGYVREAPVHSDVFADRRVVDWRCQRFEVGVG
jgi:hypothetical protein